MRRRESKPFRGIRPINEIVPILYGERDFDAFDELSMILPRCSRGDANFVLLLEIPSARSVR